MSLRHAEVFRLLHRYRQIGVNLDRAGGPLNTRYLVGVQCEPGPRTYGERSADISAALGVEQEGDVRCFITRVQHREVLVESSTRITFGKVPVLGKLIYASCHAIPAP